MEFQSLKEPDVEAISDSVNLHLMRWHKVEINDASLQS